MVAPILAFTADEAWEFLGHAQTNSVHLSKWDTLPFERSEAEQIVWKTLFELRNGALPVLEAARQGKTIGKALDAKLVITGNSPLLGVAAENRLDLRELLNVSQLEIVPSAEEGVQFLASKADGQKCERCWHWELDTGSDPQHPTLCARCVAAIGSMRG